jgi:hypothetical protein
MANAICSSFKVDLMTGRHDFTTAADSFKWALYTVLSPLGATTTAYTATNETSGTNYTATGAAFTNATPTLDSTTAYTDWDDPTWGSASFSAIATLLYNDTITTPVADASVAVWDFGTTQTASGGDFVLQLPIPDGTTGILRLA